MVYYLNMDNYDETARLAKHTPEQDRSEELKNSRNPQLFLYAFLNWPEQKEQAFAGMVAHFESFHTFIGRLENDDVIAFFEKLADKINTDQIDVNSTEIRSFAYKLIGTIPSEYAEQRSKLDPCKYKTAIRTILRLAAEGEPKRKSNKVFAEMSVQLYSKASTYLNLSDYGKTKATREHFKDVLGELRNRYFAYKSFYMRESKARKSQFLDEYVRGTSTFYGPSAASMNRGRKPNFAKLRLRLLRRLTGSTAKTRRGHNLALGRDKNGNVPPIERLARVSTAGQSISISK
jgi:hypothetical protein